MTFKIFSKLAFIALVGTLIFSSCTKDNSVTVEETVEQLPAGLRMNINGADLEIDAVAAFCQNDSVEFLIVSNKVENLTFPFNTENFEANDFVYMLHTSDSSNWGYGGQALGPDVSGLPFDLAILFSDAKISIESNDGEVVVGSSAGTLYGMDLNGEFIDYPYQMSFVAEIVGAGSSPFCE